MAYKMNRTPVMFDDVDNGFGCGVLDASEEKSYYAGQGTSVAFKIAYAYGWQWFQDNMALPDVKTNNTK